MAAYYGMAAMLGILALINMPTLNKAAGACDSHLYTGADTAFSDGYGTNTIYTATWPDYQLTAQTSNKLYNKISNLQASSLHACFIDSSDGSVWCTGTGTEGQLGTGTNVNHLKDTVKVQNLPENVKFSSVYLGAYWTCAVTEDRLEAYCFGRNSRNELGVNYTSAIEYTPTKVVGTNGRVIKFMFMSDSATCIAYQDNTLSCSGYGGEYFYGESFGGLEMNSPVQIDLPDVAGLNLKQGVGGKHHMVLLDNDGKVYCKGLNKKDKACAPDQWRDHCTSLFEVAAVGSDNAFISGNAVNTCSVKNETGEVMCWGSNGMYRLGVNANGFPKGSPGPHYIDLPVAANHVNVKDNICVTLINGKTYCWGYIGTTMKQMFGGQISTGIPFYASTIPEDKSCPFQSCDEQTTNVCGTGARICSALDLSCIAKPSCSNHTDCEPYNFKGKMPYCSSEGFCETRYADVKCSNKHQCTKIADRFVTYSKSLASIRQKFSHRNATMSRESAQTVVQSLRSSFDANNTESGLDLSVFVDAAESVTFDAALIDSLAGNQTQLEQALRDLVCASLADQCIVSFAGDYTNGTSARRLAGELLEVSVTYNIDEQAFAELQQSGSLTFGDDSLFEQALADQLGLDVSDITVYSTGSSIEVVYAVVLEADTEGDPDIATKLSSITAAKDDLDSITTTVKTQLGLDDSDIQMYDFDLCENRDCNGRGTCDSSTGVCACTDTSYWGVNCETLVSCLNGGTPLASQAYCQCPWPYLGLRCENSADCGTCN